MSEETISEEQVLHNKLNFEINKELIHLMNRILELQQENSQLKMRIEKAIKFIYKNTSYVSIECMEQGLLKSDLDKIIEILKGDKE